MEIALQAAATHCSPQPQGVPVPAAATSCATTSHVLCHHLGGLGGTGCHSCRGDRVPWPGCAQEVISSPLSLAHSAL